MSSHDDNYIYCSFGDLPDSLYNIEESDGRYNGILNYAFEGLVYMDKWGDVMPALAEDWSISSDGLTYTFYIREDAAWSDGTAITAEDFVTFFNNILSKNVKNIMTYELKSALGSHKTIREVDEKILEISLSSPDADFLKLLTQPNFTLRKDENLLDNWKENYKHINYSGAFVISNIDDKGVALEKNNYYWNKDEVTDEKFLLLENVSREAALAKYERDKINIVSSPPLSEVNRIISNNNTVIVNNSDVIGVSFNLSSKKEISDINLRKKICNTMDIGFLRKDYLREFNPDDYDVFKTVSVFNYNYNKAPSSEIYKDKADDKNEDEKNNESKNNTSSTLKLIGINNDINKQISKGIANQLKTEEKISVSVKLMEKDELSKAIEQGEYDILLEEYKRDYDKDFFMYRRFMSDYPNNIYGYDNPQLDELINNGISTDDDKLRKKIAAECGDILASDGVFMPLFHDVDIILKSDYINGIDVTPYGTIDISKIDK